MARTCAALRANILWLIEPVADATGSECAGLRPEFALLSSSQKTLESAILALVGAEAHRRARLNLV